MRRTIAFAVCCLGVLLGCQSAPPAPVPQLTSTDRSKLRDSGAMRQHAMHLAPGIKPAGAPQGP